MKHRVSLAFKKGKDAAFYASAQGVQTALAKNLSQFPSLPVSPAGLLVAVTDYKNKLIAAHQAGVAETEAKKQARVVLTGLLDTLARHVEGVAQGNPDIIAAAGFTARTGGYSPQVPLARPALVGATNVASTLVKLRIRAQRNVRSVKVQFRSGDGGWQDGGSYPCPRDTIVPQLVPGTFYQFRVQFVGGSTGVSDWSDVLTHMAT